jgi:ankyrin repeat protein
MYSINSKCDETTVMSYAKGPHMKKLLSLLCIVSYVVFSFAMDNISSLDKQLISAIKTADDARHIIKLINEGANPTNALPTAVNPMTGTAEYVRLLLQCGADVHAYDYQHRYTDKRTLLLKATVTSDPATVAILLEYKLAPHKRAYQAAIQYNRIGALFHLIAYGMNVNKPLIYGDTALIVFAGKENISSPHIIIARLIDVGANVNQKNKTGRTPLMTSVAHGSTAWRPQVINTLLEYGANPHITDNEGKSALDYAHTPELKQLIQHGIEQYKCRACMKNKSLDLIPCANKHLGSFMCLVCLVAHQSVTNVCPMCHNQLLQ